MNDSKNVVDRVWKIVEAKQLDRLGEVIDGDCHFKMPGMEVRGVAPLQQLLGAYLAGFPDLRHVEQHAVASGDTVAIELQVSGTHTGPMPTPQGIVPPTGKRVVWESCDYVRVRDGKIVSWHVYHDPTPFYAALGSGRA
jgi:predicted ester cyclase